MRPEAAGRTAADRREYAAEDRERFEEAIADCTEAIRLDPDEPRLYLERGDARSALGRYKEAIVDYDRAIQLDPDNTSAYVGRFQAKADLGLHEEALDDYDHVVRLSPDLVAETGDD